MYTRLKILILWVTFLESWYYHLSQSNDQKSKFICQPEWSGNAWNTVESTLMNICKKWESCLENYISCKVLIFNASEYHATSKLNVNIYLLILKVMEITNGWPIQKTYSSIILNLWRTHNLGITALINI